MGGCQGPVLVRYPGYTWVAFQAVTELEWGEVAERLVGADGVVDVVPGGQIGPEGGGGGLGVGDLVELLGVGALGAFDGAVELGAARREHEQAQPEALAG